MKCKCNVMQDQSFIAVTHKYSIAGDRNGRSKYQNDVFVSPTPNVFVSSPPDVLVSLTPNVFISPAP
jgi:hypothetical protein